jgi:hypothetical protein
MMTTRRALIAAIAVAATGIDRALVVRAQESTPEAIATPAAGSGGIRPTGVGEVPSTGASRPGPADDVAETVVQDAIAPVGLAIESAGVDAGIEALEVVDGVLPDPTGPWVVAWYENLGSLAGAANVVMAGHIDYWNVGPAVFFNIAGLQPGDAIVVTGDDGMAYPYAVDWVEQFDSTTMPLDEVFGPGNGQSLTLVTCGGAFDYATGEYLQRTVVRANRSGPAETVAA